MKSKLILCLALVLSGGLTSSNAQNNPALFPIIENGKPGFIDQIGKVIIQPNTDWFSSTLEGKHFVEGFEPAQTRWRPDMTNGLKWGYLNTEGKFTIAPQFTLTTPFSEGLAAVRDRFYGYVDHTGKFVIQPQFEEAYGFSEGLAQVGDTNHLMGFIGRNGKWIVPPRYRAFSPHSNFSDGLACVPTNDVTMKYPFESGTDTKFKWGYINTNGEQVIDFRFDEANAFSEGLAAVSENLKAEYVDETNGEHLVQPPFSKGGYIDKTGKYVIPPQFDGVWNFSEGLARVRVAGQTMSEVPEQMKFINKQGKIVFTVTNGEWADEFSEGLANVSIRKGVGEEIWGYIDHTGQFVIKPQFQQAKPFYNGLAQVVVDNKLAYIDKTGRFVWGPKGYNETLAGELKSQTPDAERLDNNREIVRLATLINPTNPPVTDEMLETGEFEGDLFNNEFSDVFTHFPNSQRENIEAILIRFLKYSLSPKMGETMPDMALIGEDSIREKAADTLIAIPSSAVVPILRQWLTQNLAAAEAGKFCRWGEVAEAAKGLGRFQDTNLVPLLVTAWQDGVFEKKMDTTFLGDMAARQLPEIVIMTLAEMPLPISKNILLEAMNDKRFDESIRYPIAAALVRLDDQSARDVLLDGLDKYLAPDQDTLESSRHNFAFYELQKLGDTNLISVIEAKAAVATRKRLQLVLPALVERMRINNLPVDELKRTATEEKNLNRRWQAIEVLGETGKADDLPFLESLLPLAKKYRGLQGQRNNFVRVVEAAIRNVRLHNWEQFENKT
jgi:HEAT repeat protein